MINILKTKVKFRNSFENLFEILLFLIIILKSKSEHKKDKGKNLGRFAFRRLQCEDKRSSYFSQLSWPINVYFQLASPMIFRSLSSPPTKLTNTTLTLASYICHLFLFLFISIFLFCPLNNIYEK